MGLEFENTNGVSRGIPISALLYITSAGGIMGEYKKAIRPKTLKIDMVKNLETEFKWANHVSKENKMRPQMGN